MPEELRWEEGMLEDLARSLQFPPTPDLRGPVLARLESARPTAPAAPRWRLALAGAAVVALVAAATLAFSRDARDAVADFLGIAVEGERIERLPTPPAGTTATPLPTPRPTSVAFERSGRKVTREEAAAVVELRLPASLGEPAAFYSLLGGPAIVIADYGTLQVWLMRYEGDYFIGKGVIGGGDNVQQVRVNGHPGYWVSGGERLVTVIGASGTPLTGTQRTVTASALLWSADGLYRRIEGAGSLEAAMKLAAEMQ